MADLTALKDRVCLELDAMGDSLGSLSRQIYENPELGFQERKALQWLSAFLHEAGFSVQPGTAGIETAFRAEVRGLKDRPNVALLAEYDALKGLGHACGHNLICSASVGAAAALAPRGAASSRHTHRAGDAGRRGRRRKGDHGRPRGV